MRIFCFDTECSGAQRDVANPFNPLNRLCLFSYILEDTDTGETKVVNEDIDYTPDNYVYTNSLQRIQEDIDSSDWVIGFNLKFDLAWAKRYGLRLDKKKYWDVQLVEFFLSYQQNRMPSLNGVLEKYKLATKLDVVKTEYWEVGIDTDKVPWDILVEYGAWDVHQTLAAAKIQMKEFRNANSKLQHTIRVSLNDLYQLHCMEYIGCYFNTAKAQSLSKDAYGRNAELTESLRAAFNIPEAAGFNLGSGHHLSAVLFGGSIKYVETEEFLFTYKDGKKAPVIKTRKVERFHNCPRIFTPRKGTETAREGIFQTNEDVLRNLRASAGQRRIIEQILLYAKNEKLAGTYYEGYPKRMLKSNWGDYIHTNLNQCLVVTGRLSSSSPNLQNVSGDVKVLFESRFKRNSNVRDQ